MSDGCPLEQYVYGDTEIGTALTIDVWPEDPEYPDRYQARVWSNGDTAALKYFPSFQECVGWFRTFEAEESQGKNGSSTADGLAPRTIEEDGETFTAWTLISGGQDEPDAILFDDMREEVEAVC